MEVHVLFKVFMSLALVGVSGLVARLYNVLVAQPRKLRSELRKLGLSGPLPTLLLGNILEIKKARKAAAKAATGGPPVSHNCGVILHPFLDQWRQQYGTSHRH